MTLTLINPPPVCPRCRLGHHDDRWGYVADDGWVPCACHGEGFVHVPF